METDIQLYTDMLALSHQKQAENRPEMVQNIPGGQEPAEMAYMHSCDVEKASSSQLHQLRGTPKSLQWASQICKEVKKECLIWIYNYANHICKLDSEGQPLKRQGQKDAESAINRQIQTPTSTELSPVAKQSPSFWKMRQKTHQIMARPVSGSDPTHYRNSLGSTEWKQDADAAFTAEISLSLQCDSLCQDVLPPDSKSKSLRNVGNIWELSLPWGSPCPVQLLS